MRGVSFARYVVRARGRRVRRRAVIITSPALAVRVIERYFIFRAGRRARRSETRAKRDADALGRVRVD